MFWPPFSVPIKRFPRCIFGANLVIIAQIHYELLHGQAKFPRILSQNDLESQGQWPQFSIAAKRIPGCMFGAYMVIPAQICEELSCGQEFMKWQSNRRRQRQYPFGLKGQGVKRCQKSLQTTHHLMLVIICATYTNLSSRTADVTEQTWKMCNPVGCRYKVVNSLEKPHNSHPIALSLGRVMGWFCTFKFWLL